MSFKKDKKQETIIYLALWALLFIAPVMHLYIRTNTGEEFSWSEVFMVWKQYALYFLIFLIHNHLLAPILVYKQKRVAYLLSVAGIAVLFHIYQYNHRPSFENRGPNGEMTAFDERGPVPPELQGFDDRGPGRDRGPHDNRRMDDNQRPMGNRGPMDDGRTMSEPRDYNYPGSERSLQENHPRNEQDFQENRTGNEQDFQENRPGNEQDFQDNRTGNEQALQNNHPNDGHGPMGDSIDSSFPLNDSVKIAKYNPDDYNRRPFRRPDNIKRPPLLMGQHDIIALIILILMLGMNLAVKLYFKQLHDQKQMADLEKENLEQQLEYLKYQINPHFFMNTLNNIHALVDIDPEKSKETILELSKMMRFVLYEGSKQGVPLDRDITFLQNYITLMKLRYTDKVSITVQTPDRMPQKDVPPLMFITFVENAFKHGVSYRKDSFIDVAFSIEQDNSRLHFTCKNSKIPKEEDKHGGVGLSNIRKRLELIYGDRYQLDINDTTDTYTVKLSIPL